jgi:hypothetical protein
MSSASKERLQQLLTSEHVTERLWAARQLAKQGNRRAGRVLVDLWYLQADDTQRETIVETLARCFLAGFPNKDTLFYYDEELFAAFEQIFQTAPAVATRQAALAPLCLFGGERAFEPVFAALGDPDLRDAALATLLTEFYIGRYPKYYDRLEEIAAYDGDPQRQAAARWVLQIVEQQRSGG